MTQEKSPEEIAIERFEATDWEQTWCAVQDSFETFTLAVRNDVKAELSKLIPEYAAQPFKDINIVQLVIGFGALREGARAYASLLADASPAAPRQIEYERLWEAVAKTNDPGSLSHAALREQLETLPHMDAVLAFAGNSLHANLMNKVPALKPHEERIRQLVFVNLLYGVKIEYLFPLLATQVREEAALIKKALANLRITDEAEKQCAAGLKKRLGIKDDCLPWPKDARCVCGADMSLHLVCCRPDSPVDLSSYSGRITTDFLLKTKCCGATFTGVRCQVCARYYSWASGVVDAVR